MADINGKLPDDRNNVTIRMQGQRFRCTCGGEVFVMLDPKTNHFECKTCGAIWRGA